MLYFLAWSGLVTGSAALVFGLFVYLKNKQGAVNQSYGVLSLSLVIWGFAYYFWPLAETRQQALFSFQVLHLGAIFVAPSFLWFISALLGLHEKFKKLIVSSFVVGCLFMIAVPTRLFIKDMVPQYIFRYWAVPGVMYHWYLVFWFSCTFFAGVHLFGHYRQSVGSRKNQLRYVIIASLLGFLGGATNYLPWYKIYIPPVGTILVSVHIIILAYAIVKHRLMDISVAITRTGIFMVVYALVLGLPFILSKLGRVWLEGSLGAYWWIAPLVLMAILGTVGPYFYLLLKRSAEAILFREQFRYQNTLRLAAEEMTRILNLKKLLNLLVHVITASVRISHAAVYLYDARSAQFLLGASRNIRGGQPQSFAKENALIGWLDAQRNVLEYAEIKQQMQHDRRVGMAGEIEKEMHGVNATLVIPSFLENRLVGFIVLGSKRSGRIYSSEDLNTFSVLASQFALAVENASLYNNMEEQVSQRTRELIDVQKQLVQAEKLATVGTLAGGVAHEINNPLTAILTNVQMLLADGNAIDPDSKESLELIEEATKRCRTIVQKLMVYARKPLETTELAGVDLSRSLDNIIAFLKYQLEQENIKLRIDGAHDTYPVMGNQNELEQAITNIVLNARDAIKKIKKSGEIGLSLAKSGRRVKLQIKDEGVGMSKETMARIFDPFFTTKDVGKGLGLGLSICQAIIEKHKGTISVQSKPNKGSIFTIELPEAG